jgi:hypothetical protein
MAARFVGDPEIAAGPPPLRAMRWNAARPRAKLGQQMRQLMTQSAIDLRRIVFAQTRVQRDQVTAGIRASSATMKPRVPFHVHCTSKLSGVERREDFARFRFEGRVATQDNQRRRGRENQVQLLIA